MISKQILYIQILLVYSCVQECVCNNNYPQKIIPNMKMSYALMQFFHRKFYYFFFPHKFILLGSTTIKKYIIFVKKSVTHFLFLWVPMSNLFAQYLLKNIIFGNFHVKCVNKIQVFIWEQLIYFFVKSIVDKSKNLNKKC